MAGEVYDDQKAKDQQGSSSPGALDNQTSPGQVSFNRGGLRGAEEQGASPGHNLYNPAGDQAGNKSDTAGSSSATSPGNIKRSEEAGGDGDEDRVGNGYNPGNSNATGSKKARFRLTRKQKVFGGIGAASATSVIVFFFSIASGPLEFVHIAQLLEKVGFSRQQDAEDSRLMKIARYINDPSKPQNTRLGIVGNAVANNLEAKINNATGLESVYDSDNGQFQGYAVIEGSEQYPSNMSDDEIKSAIADKYGVDADSIQRTTVNGESRLLFSPAATSGAKSLDPRNYFKQTSFARTLLGEADLSKISAYAGSRVLSERAGWTFHPIKELDSNIQAAIIKAGKAGLKKLQEQFASDEVGEVDGTLTPAQITSEAKEGEPDASGKPTAPDPTAQAASQSVEDVGTIASGETPTDPESIDAASSSIQAKIGGGAVALVGVICVMHSIDSNIDGLRETKVVLPMMRLAGQFINLGSQVQSGQDLSSLQLGLYKNLLDGTDSSGNVTSTWNQAQSIQAAQGETQGNEDLPAGAQVFNNSVPFSVIEGPVTDAVCSAAGSIFGQIVSIVTGPVSYFVTGAITKDLVSSLSNWLTGAPINPISSAGADVGNYLAYGSRASGNDQYASAGGVPMSGSDESTLDGTTTALDNADFQSKSFAYRMFNLDDNQTLASKIADNYGSSGIVQGFASMFRSFGNIFASALRAPATLLSGVTHAAQPAYSWHGLQASGFTAAELSDPTYDNSFDNACYVTGNCTLSNKQTVSIAQSILGAPGSLQSQAVTTLISQCFNDTVSYNPTEGPNGTGVWDINFDSGGPTDPYATTGANAYPTSKCESTDESWMRIRFWLLDTQTIEGYDCSQSNSTTADQSCNHVGFTDSGSSGSTPPAVTSNSAFNVQGNKIYTSSGEQYIPYGVSIVDDLEGPDWCTASKAAASDAQIQAASQYWHVNTVRIQVSETNFANGATCKGPNGTETAQDALKRLAAEVDEIEQNGDVPIINDNTEFTVYESGPTQATINFWNSVTSYLGGMNTNGKYNNVVFDIYNKPETSDSVWQKGGVYNGKTYLGMQDVVNAIRNGSNLNNNLILVEGDAPRAQASLEVLANYTLTGTNLAYAYHHVDLNASQDSWETTMGLKTGANVPIVDGEWAQYASTRDECYSSAIENVPTYLNLLKSEGIGLIFWSLEPGVGTTTSDPQPASDTITANFPTDPQDYSQPVDFGSNYGCYTLDPKSGQQLTGSAGAVGNLIGQGAAAQIMRYFSQNSSAVSFASASGSGTATQDPSKIEQGSDADLSKKLLAYKASGQYTCDNSGDCTQLEQMSNGQSIAGSSGGGGDCQVDQLDPRVLQLLLYLIEVGNFKIGTFAMCSDHSFDSSRGHSGGFAVDISSVNGQAINSDSPATKTQALALDKFLNNLPAALKLNQQIDWGYGDHPDTDIQAYQQFNGQVCGSSCEQYYTLPVEEEHENHTHAGF